MNKVFQYEVIIIGGGPAGSSAAINLSRAGFKVCIIEKKSFPRETLCGEFLSGDVISSLNDLNLFTEFINLSPNPITSFRFINNNGKQVKTDFNFTAYGLKRGAFDDFLLSSAESCGAEVIQPAEVKSIVKEGEGYLVSIKNENGNEYSLSANYVIAAYGKQNVLDKNLGRAFTKNKNKTKLNGIKFHIDSSLANDFDKSEIQIYSADGIYCGVNAVNDNAITLCFLEDREVVNHPPRKQLLKLMELNPAFSNLFKKDISETLEQSPVYGTGSIFFGKREHSLNGIFMIGDASGVIAPLAGDGIGMAFESAKLCAEVLSGVKAGKLNSLSACKKFDAEWDKKFSVRLKTAMLIQNFILNGFYRNIGLAAVKLFPGSIKMLVKATRS